LEQLALEMFGEGDPHTPAFLRKSVEGIEWKGVVKHSWCKEREERGKEREGIVPKRERWEAQGGKGRFGGSGSQKSRCVITRE
jgi:hypothetical protein